MFNRPLFCLSRDHHLAPSPFFVSTFIFFPSFNFLFYVAGVLLLVTVEFTGTTTSFSCVAGRRLHTTRAAVIWFLLSVATARNPQTAGITEEIDHHHKTHILKEIRVDYTPEVCNQCEESSEITVTFDERGGARWRSPARYLYGTFGAEIKCPVGNTSGLNINIYLSSLEGDKSQDEIDFEFLGKDKSIVQTNYYTTGTGNREEIHFLGFDCSDGFHEYIIKWLPNSIEWLIDGKLVRKVGKEDGTSYPEKPMYLYASVWNASSINDGNWTGPYIGSDAPYVCQYRNVQVPVHTAVMDS